MEEIRYKIDMFEGPLDLLLMLINKNQISISDIPIAEICDQYMQFIHEAEEMDLDIASEFLVMASHLMLMKSKTLLPQDREELEQLKEELADTLLLYQQAKKAVEELRPMYENNCGRYAKEEDEIPPERGKLSGFNPMILAKALGGIINKLRISEESPMLVAPLIKTKVYSVEEKLTEIAEKLESNGHMSMYALLSCYDERAEIIAGFMGILELIKIGRILIIIENEEKLSNLGTDIHFVINEYYVPGEEGEKESEFDVNENEESK